jgi:hypothetical protein
MKYENDNKKSKKNKKSSIVLNPLFHLCSMLLLSPADDHFELFEEFRHLGFF